VSAAQVPGEIITQIAIRDAEEDAQIARGPLGAGAPSVYGLRAKQRMYERVLSSVVLDGSPLEEARGWAMRIAMLRDCQLTSAEREAVAS
jgi:hypothetical protein